MSSHVVAIVCWGLALGELMVPYSMKLLSVDMQAWLGLAMVGATVLSAGLFTCVFLLARRHGSRFSRPQASGYELACQDDLNQVLYKLRLCIRWSGFIIGCGLVLQVVFYLVKKPLLQMKPFHQQLLRCGQHDRILNFFRKTNLSKL